MFRWKDLVAGAENLTCRFAKYEPAEPTLLHSCVKNWSAPRDSRLPSSCSQNKYLNPLGYTQKIFKNYWRRRWDLNSHRSVYKTDALIPIKLHRRGILDLGFVWNNFTQIPNRIGRGEWIRTAIGRFMRPVLCRLSYTALLISDLGFGIWDL